MIERKLSQIQTERGRARAKLLVDGAELAKVEDDQSPSQDESEDSDDEDADDSDEDGEESEEEYHTAEEGEVEQPAPKAYHNKTEDDAVPAGSRSVPSTPLAEPGSPCKNHDDEEADPDEQSDSKTEAVKPEWDFGFGPLTPYSGPIVAAQPPLADADITNAAELAGKFALVQRGNVSFTTKARRVAAAGAVGLIIVDTDDDDQIIGVTEDSPGDGERIGIPAMIVKNSVGELLATAKKLEFQVVEDPGEAAEKEAARALKMQVESEMVKLKVVLAEITGTSRVDINGATVQLVAWAAEKGRYHVRPQGECTGTPLGLRPRNLILQKGTAVRCTVGQERGLDGIVESFEGEVYTVDLSAGSGERIVECLPGVCQVANLPSV